MKGSRSHRPACAAESAPETLEIADRNLGRSRMLMTMNRARCSTATGRLCRLQADRSRPFGLVIATEPGDRRPVGHWRRRRFCQAFKVASPIDWLANDNCEHGFGLADTIGRNLEEILAQYR